MPCRFFPAGPINVGQRVPCGLSKFSLDWLDSTAYLRALYASLTVGLKGVIGA